MQWKDFEVIAKLGEGGYGAVYLAKEQETKKVYAIKKVSLKEGFMVSEMISRECTILQMLKHPNVVSLHYSFKQKKELCLVMSYIKGANLQHLLERDNIPLKHFVYLIAELLLAIEYIHRMGIMHRDIKPANCLVGK